MESNLRTILTALTYYSENVSDPIEAAKAKELKDHLNSISKLMTSMSTELNNIFSNLRDLK